MPEPGLPTLKRLPLKSAKVLTLASLRATIFLAALALEAEKRELEQKLGDAGFYANTPPADVHAASRRCADVAQELGKAEERWLEVQSELEAIGAP